ncbi:hypothetical protein AVEN_193245-1 [Araneus ventricosus]|uniref:Uncharacterized protein n=1 Tax=Araneus ventricosus TaxID=182803 RepID=A0A4Y2HN01_ARAVE|nr:hypothetical protein AVEN_193245-1 [Araneus ventricosus]
MASAGAAKVGNRKTESPRPAVASWILNDRGHNDSSSTKAGVLVGHHRPDLSRRRYTLSLVEGLEAPHYRGHKRVPAYLSGRNSYPYIYGDPPVCEKLVRNFRVEGCKEEVGKEV